MTSAIFAAVRAFLLAALPPGVEVVMAQENRVATPIGTDFVTMTPGPLRERLATNVDQYSDGFATGMPQKRMAMASTRTTVQIDVHGPSSADNTQIISTLWRDSFAVDLFAATGEAIIPLYTSDPRQMPFDNGEQQVEMRWSIDLVMQLKPIVTSAQDFASALSIGLKEVDAVYPPGKA